MKSVAIRTWGAVSSWLRGVPTGTNFSDSSCRPAVSGDIFAQPSVSAQELDDNAVDQFAVTMKAKLAAARAKGRNGWNDKERCDAEWLSELLYAALENGDLVSIANYCMMLHQRGETLAKPASIHITLLQAIRALEDKYPAIDRVRRTSGDPDLRGHAADFIAAADDLLCQCWLLLANVPDSSKVKHCQPSAHLVTGVITEATATLRAEGRSVDLVNRMDELLLMLRSEGVTHQPSKKYSGKFKEVAGADHD